MNSSAQAQRPPLQVKPDFEPYWATIQHLYIAERMTLAQVMATMEEIHGFRATEKQYKTTLKAWGLVKKVTKQTKTSIVRALESRERGGKKTASVKLCGAPVSEEKIGRWKREAARAAESRFDAGCIGIGGWREDSEMLDVEFVSEDEDRDEDRDETMDSTGAAPVASMGENSSRPGSPHTITPANPQNQPRRELDYQNSHGTSDAFSRTIDRFERAWQRVDHLPAPDADYDEEYDFCLEYQHNDNDDGFWRQPDLLSELRNPPMIGILDASWGYPGKFSKLPATDSVCGEPSVVGDADDTDDDNDCTEDTTEDVNCIKNIDYSEDADYAKDTHHADEDSDQELISLLYRAASEGDQGLAESLLTLAQQLGRGFSNLALLNSLKIASTRGHTEIVNMLLDSDVSTTIALREAAMAGRLESLPPLLDKGGYQPGALSFASRGKSGLLREDICRLLLDHGADVDEMSSEPGEFEWGPPLLEAGTYDNSGVFKLLLDRGASLDLAFKAQQNKRPWAKNSDFSHTKLDGGTNEPVLDATKALFLVLREGDSKLAAILTMCYGANNNDALVIAARHGDEAVAKRLLDGGADPFQPNSSGLSAIEAARRSHRQDLVKLLLRQSREPPHDRTSLRECFALRARFISQCRNISDVAGRLPTHLAVEGEKLSRDFLDHRPAFRSAMSSMRSLSVLEAPDNVGSLLAYLCLARAMTDLIRSKTGTDFTGEFQDGILSFFEVLKHDKFKPTSDILLYEQVVRLAWGVELSQESSSSGSDDENIRRMKDLAAKLLIQSTQLTDSEDIIRADYHPSLEEHVAPGRPSLMAKQPIGSSSFDMHALDLSSKTFPPSRAESLDQPCGIAESSKQDHWSPDLRFGEHNARDGGGIKAAIIRIATGTLFALMILLLHRITQATKGTDPLSTFAATAYATHLSSTPQPNYSDALHSSTTSVYEDAPAPSTLGTALSVEASMTWLPDPTLLPRPATPSMAEWTPNWSNESPDPPFTSYAHPMATADSLLTTPRFSDRTI
ncbi:hypothetical protein CEP54_004026 [Fusarium duplospermum]|uniref:Clr5 domain-containing protein n=1 Tax=Fusarium duplospermum TaxID=1325734 RepID=A0A428QLG0_9HYPO|nr:hypothetical protein CEP54_004026 [Fusarium duplospermum]